MKNIILASRWIQPQKMAHFMRTTYNMNFTSAKFRNKILWDTATKQQCKCMKKMQPKIKQLKEWIFFKTVKRTNNLGHINEKKYHFLKSIKFTQRIYTSLTDRLVMGYNMKIVFDVEKLKSPHLDFWCNSWMFLSAWVVDNKSINMAAVVAFAENPSQPLYGDISLPLTSHYVLVTLGLLCYMCTH